LASLRERVTHRSDEFFVVERFHEKCNRANGHGGRARAAKIFARGGDKNESGAILTAGKDVEDHVP
jgi:hypothetical protein